MKWDPNKTVPKEIADMAVSLGRWMEMNDATSISGIGPVFPLQRQLAEVTQQRDTALATLAEVQAAAVDMMSAADSLLREREQYRAACALADALRKKGRGS